MELNCTIRFENHGELIRKTGVPANEIWLDVGNALQMGCIDHHHVEGYESTLSALISHTEFLSAFRQCAEEGRPVVIHLHRSPDLDCVASYYALLYYLKHGETALLEYFSPEGDGWPLLCYINDIDAGRKKDTSSPTLYAVFCETQETEENMPDETMLEKGLRLLELGLELQKKTGGNLADMDLTDHLPEEFEVVLKRINGSSFKEEKESGRVHFETVSLWKHTGETMTEEDVCAAIWKQIPSYSNAYDHARKEGALLTVIPWKIKGEDEAGTTKVVISIDPDKDPENHYTLRPLAEIIEQMEQVEEESLYEQTGNYRRDHSEPRSSSGVFGEMPFASTSDPWYIRNDESLIDTPRMHSVLDYEDILKVIRNNGSAVRKAFTVAVAGDNAKLLYKGARIPLCTWQDANRLILSEEKSYVVVWAEVDSSLIRKNTRMLEAYCMSLTGRPFSERNENNLYFPDYRTCIYSDLNCTIVLVATYDDNNLKQLPVASLAGLPAAKEAESFRNSRLVDIVFKLLSQRERLLSFGTRVGSVELGRRKELEKLYSEILSFSADAQKEDMISNAFERELYLFIKGQFCIDELKNSVMEEMKLVVEESRNKLVSGFNILTAIAAPFLLISAIFEMGIIRFYSLLDLTAPASYWGWLGIIIIGALTTYLLLRKK